MIEKSETFIDLSPIQQFDLNLEQYFGLWGVEEARFLSLFDQVRRMDLAAHVVASRNSRDIQTPSADFVSFTAAESAARDGRTPAQVDNEKKIAVIDINGTITKRGSSLSDSGSTIRIGRQLRIAARDQDVAGIIIRIDSPGGTIAGTPDLAREIASANQRKPVYAFVEDMTASAAYWIASQAGKIFANDNTALIGSIGNFIALYDFSGEAEQMGIKAIVIRSGEFKGIGFPGREVTEEHQQYLQSIVDKTQVEFTGGVAKGRDMAVEKVNEIADGRVHPALDALDLKLIDGIQTFEETVAMLQRKVTGGKTRSPKSTTSISGKENRMTTETETQTQAATLKELKAACPGAESEFILDQLDRGATVAEAQKAFIENRNEQLKMRDEETEKLKAQNKELEEKSKQTTPSRGATKPIGNGGKASASTEGETIEDPIEAFNSAVEEKVTAGMKRQRAVAQVAARNPELHRAYLLATNPGRKQQRQIEEKYEVGV